MNPKLGSRAGWLLNLTLSALIFGVASAQATSPSVLQGRVIRVLDGDTLEIRKGAGGAEQNVRVRFFAIDAPESTMPWGKVCRQKLAQQVAGREVTVQVKDRDQYGRTVGQVFLDSASELRDINLAMVQSGCAWHYKQFSGKQSAQDRRQYAQAEQQARLNKQGLWIDPRPQAPWAYRSEKRRK